MERGRRGWRNRRRDKGRRGWREVGEGGER